MRSTIRCTVCSSSITLLAFPDLAGGGLARARVVSTGGALFSIFGENDCFDPISLFTRRDAYQLGCVSWNKPHGQRVVCNFQSMRVWRQQLDPGGDIFFIFAVPLSSFCLLGMVCGSTSSTSRTWWIVINYSALRRICLYPVCICAYRVLLLLYVLLCWC